jgi:hypothetical protein
VADGSSQLHYGKALSEATAVETVLAKLVAGGQQPPEERLTWAAAARLARKIPGIHDTRAPSVLAMLTFMDKLPLYHHPRHKYPDRNCDLTDIYCVLRYGYL